MAFDAALEEILEFPEAWPQIEGTFVRTRQLRGFPYSIIYVNDPDAVYILAVAHQRREPLYWQRRLEEPGRE